MYKRYGIMIICAVILVLCFMGTTSARTWSVDDDGGADFIRIQDAINNAKDGDSILVYSGVYYENVVVNKSVTLEGNGQPVVDAGKSGSAITLTAEGITLEGFNATNSGRMRECAGINVISSNNTITGNNVSYYGIYLDKSSNNTITGNNVYGIRLSSSSNNNTITGNNVCSNKEGYGIILSSSSNNNTITGNNVCSNSGYSIRLLYSSNNNTITGNNVCNNNDHGIYLSHSSNNTITGNNVCNNRICGITLDSSSNNNTITGNTFVNDGLRVSGSYQNTVEDNTVNGKPLVYLEDVSESRVEDAGQVILVNCSNITVENLDLSNTTVGIELWNTKDSKILNNTVCNNNWDSISLAFSNSNNTITGNNVCSNGGYSINLDKSNNNNTITGNNVCSNYGFGIRLGFSNNNNTITGNNVCNNNGHGIILTFSSNNNTITGNNVCNNNWDGIRLACSSNNSITANNVCDNNDDGIILSRSNNNNTITGNNVCNNRICGITLDSSSNNNTITGNNASNNMYGITLDSSSKNTISGNNVRNNSDGIILDFSSNNNIYLNNVINNTENVYSSASTNIWNSPEKITYTYLGTTYESYLGNYWDDYDGTDADGDGIGITPYSIDSESDDYPLMKPSDGFGLSDLSDDQESTGPTPGNAEILEFSHTTGTVEPWSEVAAVVVISNTGTTARSFWVGLSYKKQGTSAWINIPPQQSVDLYPGGSANVQFNWTVTNEPGTYDIFTKIWDGYDASTDQMIPPSYAERTDTGAFIIADRPGNQIFRGTRAEDFDDTLNFPSTYGTDTVTVYYNQLTNILSFSIYVWRDEEVSARTIEAGGLHVAIPEEMDINYEQVRIFSLTHDAGDPEELTNIVSMCLDESNSAFEQGDNQGKISKKLFNCVIGLISTPLSFIWSIFGGEIATLESIDIVDDSKFEDVNNYDNILVPFIDLDIIDVGFSPDVHEVIVLMPLEGNYEGNSIAIQGVYKDYFETKQFYKEDIVLR